MSQLFRRVGLLAGAAALVAGAIWFVKNRPAEGSASSVDAEPAQEVELLNVPRAGAPLGNPNPDSVFWQDVPRAAVTLLAQPIITPRPEKLLTERVVVQAIHDGKTLALRLVWEDSEESWGGKLSEYSDAVAVQFPSDGQPSTPVMMGTKGMPVHILHWRAQYQLDEDQGKPDMVALYPNKATDMYAMDFKEAPGGTPEEKASFSPALVVGNPQSERKAAVDEILAEGFGTSAVQKSSGVVGRGVWRDKRWAVVIHRPLSLPERSQVSPAGETQLAFAIWQGGGGEVGSRKAVTMSWLPARLN